MIQIGPAVLEFLTSQRIGRLASISPTGWPQVVPVMYEFDAGEPITFEFDVDGSKQRNLAANPRAALVVDTFPPKRGVSIQGLCTLTRADRARLEPSHIFSWGL